MSPGVKHKKNKNLRVRIRSSLPHNSCCCRLMLLHWFPGQSDSTFVRWRVVEEILKQSVELSFTDKPVNKPTIKVNIVYLKKNKVAYKIWPNKSITLIRMLMLLVIFRATTLILF